MLGFGSPPIKQATKKMSTPTPSMLRQNALAACVHALSVSTGTNTDQPMTFSSLFDGTILKKLLVSSGFPCTITSTTHSTTNNSSRHSSQSRQSSTCEADEPSMTSLDPSSDSSRASRSGATELLHVRDQVSRTLVEWTDTMTMDDLISARRGSTTELARLTELVLVCCCVHGVRREEHVHAILSLHVNVQAEIMDVINYHVGERENSEEEEEVLMSDGSGNGSGSGHLVSELSPSPLAAKFRAMSRYSMSPATVALFGMSPSPNKTTGAEGRGEGREEKMERKKNDSSNSSSSSSSGDSHHYDAASSTSSSQHLLRVVSENEELKVENSRMTSTVESMKKRMESLRAQLDSRTKESHRLKQSSELKTASLKAEYEDLLHLEETRARDSEAKVRRLEERTLQMRQLEEELNSCRDLRAENETLQTKVERCQRRLRSEMPVLKRTVAEGKREAEERRNEIDQLTTELASTKIEMPRMRMEMRRQATELKEMEEETLRLNGLMEEKNVEIFQMMEFQHELRQTAQRWLGVVVEEEEGAGAGEEKFIQRRRKRNKLAGMPSSLVEFMAKVATEAPSTTTTTTSMFSLSSSSSSSSSSNAPTSPSTPTAAHRLLSKWVGTSGGSSDGGLSPGSQLGSPHVVSTPRSMMTATTPSSSSVNSILRHESNTSKLALRLARLEEQNRELEEKRSVMDSKAQEDINRVTNQLKTSAKSLLSSEKRGAELQVRVDKLTRELSQSRERHERLKTSSELDLDKARMEAESRGKEMVQMMSRRKREEVEMERLRELLAETKLEQRNVLSSLRSE